MILKALLLFVFPLIGGLIPLLIKTQNSKVINILLILGGSYLLCVCLYHLIPESFSYTGTKLHIIGLFILLGFLLQLLLEQLSHGIEHGHDVNVTNTKPCEYNLGLLVGLSIHSFMESVPLAYSLNNSAILLGIAIHHIPIGILLTNYSIKHNCSKLLSVLISITFALTSPLGYSLGLFIISTSFNHYSPYITAFASGIILYISTTILFESSSSEHIFNKTSFLSIILGILLFFVINITLTHHHVH